MRAKTSVYVDMPHTTKVKGRLKGDAADLNTVLRRALPQVVTELLNEHILDVRAKFAKVISDQYEFKDNKAKSQVTSIMSDFFDAYVTTEKWNDIEDDEDEKFTWR